MISEPKKIAYAFVPPSLFLLLLWSIALLQWDLGWNLWQWGIAPRKVEGLYGIALHVFIHSGIYHLLANSVPLLVLGWLLFYFYADIAPKMFVWLCLLPGLFLWVAGRPGWHVGASTLIYGLMFFLFWSGIIRRHAPLVAVSLVVIFLYGSIVWNMFPIAELVNADTSWEGHLGGAVVGTVLAWVYRRHGPQREVHFEDEDEEMPVTPETDGMPAAETGGSGPNPESPPSFSGEGGQQFGQIVDKHPDRDSQQDDSEKLA